MIKEHSRVVLRTDLAEGGLSRGDVGTVVHIHDASSAFEVEFVALDGQTLAVVTLTPDQIRPVAPGEIANARRVA